MARPTVAFLDVNDTLSDLASVEPAFVDAGLRAEDVRIWYLSVLRDGFALTVLGDAADFAELGQSQLRSMLRLADRSRDVKSADVVASGLMRSFIDAAPHLDVVPGITALAGAGLRVYTLSNGSADVARRLLGSTDAGPAITDYLAAADGGAWKPAPASYRHGLQVAGVDAPEALMVAVHPWDLEGARRVGLQTAWINRDGADYPDAFASPDHTVASFTDLGPEIDSHHS
ncbi:HAD-IA family hydrolase [Williamsia serinedens]|uniref:2-haloacid dehalogenase n=1 Tax=Williamsia serinedens TaxID=391736 RepID=A0ABT1H0Q9_9NOCA|nr:HAD-IA family hydrolase [Williamsia serinedens]MCP2160832.1 2-haloacid dehalogenase [Williamsia serinedens]